MSKRQQMRDKQRRNSRMNSLLVGSAIVALFLVVGYAIWLSATPHEVPTATPSPVIADTNMVGDAVAVSPDRSHIDEGSDPGPYSTNPPTSGHHYPVWMDAGFYDTNTKQYPQGYLVHNLEHGYVIFWYNCKSLSDSQCSDLKSQIKSVMNTATNFKVIAYPWDSISAPVVMTSWGYTLSFDKFDTTLASTFVQQHRNRAPEPEAP